MANTDLKSMLNDPVGTFGQPAAVLERGDLSHAEKRSILERWRHEVRSNSLSGTDSAPMVAEIERTLERLADEPDDAGKPGHGIIAVFHDRAQLEATLDVLQGAAINRANITLLTRPSDKAEGSGSDTRKPVDRGEESNVGGLVAGMPTYIGAVLAAGATAATGGVLAGVALAAVGGAAAGGALGGGAARLLKSNVDATYEQQMATGGIVILVVPRDAEEAARVRNILTEQGATDVREQELEH